MILIIKRKFDCFGSVLSDKDAIGFPFLCKDSKFQTVLKRIFILHPLVKSAILYIYGTRISLTHLNNTEREVNR